MFMDQIRSETYYHIDYILIFSAFSSNKSWQIECSACAVFIWFWWANIPCRTKWWKFYKQRNEAYFFASDLSRDRTKSVSIVESQSEIRVCSHFMYASTWLIYIRSCFKSGIFSAPEQEIMFELVQEYKQTKEKKKRRRRRLTKACELNWICFIHVE